jgi:hypothetical protein
MKYRQGINPSAEGIGGQKREVQNREILESGLRAVCLMMSVYHTQFFASQELFIKFMEMWCRKCYNEHNISKILRCKKINRGDFILMWCSGGISFQNPSQVEKYEENFMLTWNSDRIYVVPVR